MNESEWSIDFSLDNGHMYRLISCPPGYMMGMDYSFPDQDRCIECEPGKYSLVVATNASSLCLACPIGGSCPGGSTVIAVDGYWKKDYSRSFQVESTNLAVARIFRCAPGTYQMTSTN